MIVGGRAGARRLPPAAALALALGAALTVFVGLSVAVPAAASASASASGPATAGATTAIPGGWARAWAWRSGSGGLPAGCAPYSGRTSAGMRWYPSLVRIVGGRLGLTTTGGTAHTGPAGSGVGCTGRAQRYGRLEVRARMPRGRGLVGRIALWPSTAGGGSDWSGLTVPSADVSPAYATNGCGDDATGAAVPARLAGAFHDYLLTWSPHRFSVAVDGRTLYQDDSSFDRPRWLGISLAATGRAATGAQLLVEKVVAFRWTGPVPPAAGTALDAVSSTPDVLGGPRLSGPWLIGGGCMAVGVLVGVARAARAARRRPLLAR